MLEKNWENILQMCVGHTNINQIIWQQDNAPIHISKKTKKFLNNKEINIMTWPPYSPDINLIQNLWAIVKRNLYGKA